MFQSGTIIGITIYLVGGLEPWSFMTFHILGIIIPTDFHISLETTNQIVTHEKTHNFGGYIQTNPYGPFIVLIYLLKMMIFHSFLYVYQRAILMIIMYPLVL